MNKQNPSISTSQTSSLISIGELLSKTWQVYKSKIKVFLGIMLLPVLINIVFFLVAAGAGLAGLAGKQFLKISLGGALPFMIVLGIILFLGVIIIGLWAQIALLFAIKERKQQIGIKASFAKGWHKIISFLWISILTSLVTMAGFLLLVVPGIIFAVWFSLAPYVLVSEGLKGKKALSRSRQLVKGNWGKVFWRLFIITAISLIISISLSFITNVANLIIPLFLTPFVIVYTYLLYENIKRLKEGRIAV